MTIPGHVPAVHWNEIIVREGKQYYKAEITDGAGTHGILLDKDKVDKGLIKIKSSRASPSFYAQLYES